MMKAAVLAIVASAIVCGPAAAAGDSTHVADFYKGKTVTIFVASGAGGGFDAVARTLSRHMGKHIPGNPTMIVSNMPGAGGLLNANFMYNSAVRDGTAIAASFNTVMMLPLFGDSAAKFDPRKFGWLGSTDKQQGICVVRQDVPVKTIDDLRHRETIAGATALNANPGIYPTLMNALFGTKFKIVSGYSTSGNRLALERGEIESICGLAYQTHMAANPHWFTKKLVHVVTQFGLAKNKNLPDVPLAIDELTSEADRQVYKMVVLPQEIGRPYLTPPNVPADRLAALQKAFAETMEDPDFIAESTRAKQSLDPTTPEEIRALWDSAYAVPKDIVERAAHFANPK